MATVTKDFRVKNGIVVEGTTATVNGHDVLTKAIADAKGDLLVGTADNAISRLAAGTNGYVLTADSSTTEGIKWAAAPAVGSFETSIVFEGATADSFETTLQVTDATADRTITFPDATGTVALTSDIPSSTSGLSEGTNLYFTDERAQDAIGNSVGTGLSYNDTTGAVSVDTITIQARVADVSDTEIGYLNGVTSAIQTQLDAKFATANASTTNISEGTNLYFTDERAQDAVGNSVGTGLSYNDTTGAVSVDTTTIQARVADVSDTEIGYLNGVTSAIQTQLDDKSTASKTETLTNKTLTSPVVTGLTLNDSSIVFEGSSADANETTLTVANPTADRTITLPDATTTLVGTDTTQTLSNKTLASPTISVSSLTAFSMSAVYVTDSGSEIIFEFDTPNGTVANANTSGGVLPITISGGTAIDGVYSLTLLAYNPGANWYGSTTNATLLSSLSGSGLLTAQHPNAVVSVGSSVTVSATEISYLDTVSSNIQTQLNAKASLNSPTLVTPNIGVATGTSLVLSGDLTVNGTTTTINSTEITIDDKNLVLGSVASPSDAGADGGGLTLKGATDKTFNWVDATDSWTSSEHLDLASSKVLKIAGTQVLSATEYTGNAATVTNGVYTTSKISALAATSSSELAGVISDETGTGALVFADTPTLTTPNIGAATATSLTLTDALIGTATQALTGGTATVVDSWSGTTYSSAKYLVQMKKGTEIQTLEVLINVDGSNNVAITEYADVINAEASLGTTDADYSGGNVRLLVTASDGTTVKVHKTLIEA